MVKKMKTKLFTLIDFLIVSIFIYDLMRINSLQEDLERASEIISNLISRENGLSNELIDYLNHTNYIFYYDDTNPHTPGSIAYYSLTGSIMISISIKKEITLTKAVILGINP